jgi:16S rRNA (adenine1518-N6/adenine1519-N6)-dimethyltransferase
MADNARINIRPKQSLGQNFLIDDNIARNIVRELHLSETDVVVEIGPGKGALTKHLVGKARKLFAVEVDKRVVGELRDKFQSENVEIVHQDFLEVRLSEWQEKFKTKLRLVGNIPYHLTSPILFKAFEERNSIQDITIMVQREVAKRIASKPNTKDYGILSVLAHFYGIPKCLFNVSPNCFYPKPKVTSTVVQIHLHDELLYNVNEKLFSSVVRTAFGKRRKTLRNSLSYLPYDASMMETLLEKIYFPLDKRPEQLTVEQFVGLTNQIEQILRRHIC